MVNEYLDYVFLLLAQFAGGPGPKENNLVRFGIPALLFGVLLWVAWSRQRHEDLPREKWLVWGFGLGFARELFMFLHVGSRILFQTEYDHCISEPLEHAMAMAAMVPSATAVVICLYALVRTSPTA